MRILRLKNVQQKPQNSGNPRTIRLLRGGVPSKRLISAAFAGLTTIALGAGAAGAADINPSPQPSPARGEGVETPVILTEVPEPQAINIAIPEIAAGDNSAYTLTQTQTQNDSSIILYEVKNSTIVPHYYDITVTNAENNSFSDINVNEGASAVTLEINKGVYDTVYGKFLGRDLTGMDEHLKGDNYVDEGEVSVYYVTGTSIENETGFEYSGSFDSYYKLEINDDFINNKTGLIKNNAEPSNDYVYGNFIGNETAISNKSNLTISGNFYNNTGSAIYSTAGTLGGDGYIPVGMVMRNIINDSTFINNSSSAEISNTADEIFSMDKFEYQTPPAAGGAISNYATLDIDNSYFFNNSSKSMGGAIYTNSEGQFYTQMSMITESLSSILTLQPAKYNVTDNSGNILTSGYALDLSTTPAILAIIKSGMLLKGKIFSPSSIPIGNIGNIANEAILKTYIPGKSDQMIDNITRVIISSVTINPEYTEKNIKLSDVNKFQQFLLSDLLGANKVDLTVEDIDKLGYLWEDDTYLNSLNLNDVEHWTTTHITNSSFFNNHADSTNPDIPAKGGAIYSAGDLTVTANDGTDVVFKGNYVTNNGVRDDNAIHMAETKRWYVESMSQIITYYLKYLLLNEDLSDKNIEDEVDITYQQKPSTLRLKAENCGRIFMFDKISGDNGETIIKNVNSDNPQTAEIDETKHYNIKFQGDSTGAIYLLNDIENEPNVTLEDTNLYLGRENVLDGSSFTVNSGTLSLINNHVGVMNLESFLLGGDADISVDVDLAKGEMDRITANSYGEHKGNLNVVGMNMLSDLPTDKNSQEIYFAQPGLKDNVVNKISETPTAYQTTAYTPIYKYNVAYDNRTDGGYFMFAKGDQIIVQPSGNDNNGGTSNNGTSGGTSGGGSGITTIPTGNPSDAFNPAVLASPVAAQAGATSNVNHTFSYAFQNVDNFMNIPYLERVAMKNANKYALSPTGDATDVGTFSPLFTEKISDSIWVKPYASFENIPLKNGPKVSNITYGTLVGYDSEMQQTKHGWDRVWTGYIGYNGASQRYSGVDSTQNGGLLGGTLTMYKGNFFNATTVSTGASVASNDTMYGHENFAMLMAGIGNKTGYNFEFKEGKFIVQPSMLTSYTFVNTFDYTNAAGVRINSEPLHALQLAPTVKFIGNFKGGWQPYLSAGMVWNLLDKSNVHANDVKLPEMSVKPYVQYGIGLQKRFKDDKCMAFGQVMIQNGGRNGISMNAGFRWALGRDGKKIDRTNEKVSLPAPKISLNGLNAGTNVPSLNEGRSGRVTNELSNLYRNDKPVQTAQGGRKILKQMTVVQKAAYNRKYNNTTITSKSAVLKQM